MERGSHNVDLKHVLFNRSNDHANNLACLDDRAIMAIFETCAIKNAQFNEFLKVLVSSILSKVNFGQVERLT